VSTRRASGARLCQAVEVAPVAAARLRYPCRTAFPAGSFDADRRDLHDRAKIGPDNDNRPGGCDNVLVSIGRAGVISPRYNRIAD